MKKLIKGIVVLASAAAILCTTNVMAGTVGLSATLSSNQKQISYTYTPSGGTFQVLTLTGYQYHAGSNHYYLMKKDDSNYTHRYYGGNGCTGTYTALSGYVYTTIYKNERLKLTATTDNIECGSLYPQ